MQTEPKKLYRSRTDRMIGGVCAGIGDYLNLDSTVVRLLFVLLAFFSGGVPALVAYLVLLIVVPEEPAMSPTPYTTPAETVEPIEPPTNEPPSPEI